MRTGFLGKSRQPENVSGVSVRQLQAGGGNSMEKTEGASEITCTTLLAKRCRATARRRYFAPVGIGVMLRNKLGAASPSTELLAQISNAQPPSVDVAKKLAIADEAMQRYDAAKARDELLQVIAKIPGYAPGYASSSDAWSALGYREKAVAAAQQAVTHGSGLPREIDTLSNNRQPARQSRGAPRAREAAGGPTTGG